MQQSKWNFKKGDQVIVTVGKDKGKQGKITRTLRAQNRVVVEGVNQVKRHVKSSQAQSGSQGGFVTKEAPLHVSNVMMLDPESGKPTRVGRKWIEPKKKESKGKWVRFAKKSGFVFDKA